MTRPARQIARGARSGAEAPEDLENQGYLAVRPTVALAAPGSHPTAPATGVLDGAVEKHSDLLALDLSAGLRIELSINKLYP